MPKSAEKKETKNSKKNELKSTESTQLATLPDDLLQDADDFQEDISAQDMALSYFSPLAGNSPQCQEGTDKYNEDARPGMIIDNVTQELIEGRTKGIQVIPCYHEKKIVEWVPRDQGGGWVAEHHINSGIEKKATKDSQGRLILDNGNQVVETAYLYAIILKGDDTIIPDWGVIPFKSTQLSKFRQLNTYKKKAVEIVNGRVLNLAPFAYKYNFTTAPESNTKGSWYGWKITPGGLLAPVPELSSNHIYQAAKAYAAAVKSGVVRATSAAIDNTGSDTVPAGSDSEDGVPWE